MVAASGLTQAPTPMLPNLSSATDCSAFTAPASAMMASRASRSASTNSSAPWKAMMLSMPLKEICRGLSEGLCPIAWKTSCIFSAEGNSYPTALVTPMGWILKVASVTMASLPEDAARVWIMLYPDM